MKTTVLIGFNGTRGRLVCGPEVPVNEQFTKAKEMILKPETHKFDRLEIIQGPPVKSAKFNQKSQEKK